MYFILNENIMKTFSVSVRRRWSNTLQRKKRGNYATRSVIFFLCCFFQDGSTLAASQRAYHPDEFCKSETLKIGIL